MTKTRLEILERDKARARAKVIRETLLAMDCVLNETIAEQARNAARDAYRDLREAVEGLRDLRAELDRKARGA